MGLCGAPTSAYPYGSSATPHPGGEPIVPRTVRDVVFVDGVRTPFGKAGPKGIYHETRADDLVVKAIRELLRRNPGLDPARIDEVAVAATTQIGDQGLTIGRTAGILAGLPTSVPGYSIDRMCAGALTAVTTTAGSIAFGAYDIVVAGGVEHMGRHPMGEGVDPNPRFVSEKLVDESALFMGMTAENLHDRFPHLTKLRADEYAVRSQEKAAKAYANGAIQQDLVPVSVRRTSPEGGETGWGLATADEPMRPGTTLEQLAALKTPFRPHGRITAGNSAGLNDGATASLIAAEDFAREQGLPVKMRLVSYAFAGVEPEVMGYGPIPATEKALAKAGLSISDIGLFEVNEAFAVQVLAFLDHYGIADDDERVNQYGGAIAFGHPLASSGVRLMTQLARQFEEHPQVRYGLTTMCVGFGMGATVIWENPHFDGGSK
jgi:acetyl-CoA acyltransferase